MPVLLEIAEHQGGSDAGRREQHEEDSAVGWNLPFCPEGHLGDEFLRDIWCFDLGFELV